MKPLTFEDYMAKDNLRMYATILRVAKLHKPINGPYDDIACNHCTDLVSPRFTGKITDNELSKPPIYVEYPCPTIKALEGETE